MHEYIPDQPNILSVFQLIQSISVKQSTLFVGEPKLRLTVDVDCRQHNRHLRSRGLVVGGGW